MLGPMIETSSRGAAIQTVCAFALDQDHCLTDTQIETTRDWLQRDEGSASVLLQHNLDVITYDLLKRYNSLHFGEALAGRYRTVRVAQLAAEHTYADILEALNVAGIRPIVQKGLWLSRHAYPFSWWRQYADMDLLVHPQDMRRVDEVARAAKFKPLYSALPGLQEIPTWVDDRAIDCCEYKHEFYNIDVHYCLIPYVLPHRLDMQKFWQSLVPGKITFQEHHAERSLQTMEMNACDLVLHLLLHASQHHLEAGVRVFLDVLLAIRFYGKQWSWQLLVERAKALQIEYLVVGPLAVLGQFFSFAQHQIPADLLEQLDPEKNYREHYLHEDFIRTFINCPHQLTVGKRNFFSVFQNLSGWRYYQAALRQLWPNRYRMAARYGNQPYSLKNYGMYLKRPAALLKRYPKSMLTMLRSRF